MIEEFSRRVFAIEKFNANHGNIYVGGKNYLLASQAVKILKEITAKTGKNKNG